MLDHKLYLSTLYLDDDVKNAIQELWMHNELNNGSMYMTNLDMLKQNLEDGLQVQPLIDYFLFENLDDNEDVIIDYWW